MFNSLRAAYEPTLDALATLMAEEVDQVERYAALADAVAAGDADLAPAAGPRTCSARPPDPCSRPSSSLEAVE